MFKPLNKVATLFILPEFKTHFFFHFCVSETHTPTCRWHGTVFVIQFTVVSGCVSSKLCNKNVLSSNSTQMPLIHSLKDLLPICEENKVVSLSFRPFHILPSFHDCSTFYTTTPPPLPA